MFQRAFDHIRDDLHVAVAVGAKPRSGSDPVLIDNPQRAEAHVTGVVVVAKRKGVTTVQPPQIGRAAFLRASHCDHGQLRECIVASLKKMIMLAGDDNLPNHGGYVANSWTIRPLDKLQSIRAFAKVVQHGSFAAAAREMRLSRSAVSKYVIDLEQDLGTQLLVPTTRSASPPRNGQAYYERCTTILADLEEADLVVTRLQAEPRGILRVNAPMSFG